VLGRKTFEPGFHKKGRLARGGGRERGFTNHRFPGGERQGTEKILKKRAIDLKKRSKNVVGV